MADYAQHARKEKKMPVLSLAKWALVWWFERKRPETTHLFCGNIEDCEEILAMAKHEFSGRGFQAPGRLTSAISKSPYWEGILMRGVVPRGRMCDGDALSLSPSAEGEAFYKAHLKARDGGAA